ncbi:UNVERIFIED_CONTAM: Fe-Mn family superoxide dismutase [Brevibacillus sp. OAP136]
MVQTAKDLQRWSEWGRQWLLYLRKKPELMPISAQQLRKFENAFQQIGQQASVALAKNASEDELRRLSDKAESVQTQFQQVLQRVQQRNGAEQSPKAQLQQASYQQPRAEAVVHRPVPIGGHKLPPLPYAYDALEPFIDAETMRLHHSKHHQSYVDGLNKAETALQKARSSGDFDLLKHWERELAFNGAGHNLHTLFWTSMRPEGNKQPEGDLNKQLERDFGGFAPFRQQFSQAAEKVEGGGWAILVWSPRAQRLEILQAEKHQNLSQWDAVPLLPLDVWEHAYYLSYQNNRPRYVDAWWNVVNWDAVQNRFDDARQLRWTPY